MRRKARPIPWAHGSGPRKRLRSDAPQRSAERELHESYAAVTLNSGVVMDIRFISSLTAEDEEQFAPVVLKALSAVLDHLPIAYTVRIETIGARTFSHSHTATGSDIGAGRPGTPSTTPAI